LRFKDRHERDFVLQPTSEEVVTDLARSELKSYRRLPMHFYQIQTKFRDERRPRFGILRGREFVMKDGYSFHADYADLEREYRNMHETYTRIFTRLGLEFRAVARRHRRHRRHRLARVPRACRFRRGRDRVLAGIGLRRQRGAGRSARARHARIPKEALQKVATPGKTKCEDVAALLKVDLKKTVKAVAVMHDDELHLLLLRGDHELNEIKAQKVIGAFRFAGDKEIESSLGSKPGYIGPPAGGSGPFGAKVKVVADRRVALMSDFVCGANEEGYHLTGANFGRDVAEPQVADLRNVVAGDPSPDGKGRLEIVRGIEVGHIFQLRTKYSSALNAVFLDEKGDARPMEMGCYGIGVTRVVAAAIEQNHDERGIAFPAPIAPFAVALVPIGYHKSAGVRAAAEQLHDELGAAGIDVLMDDRDERPGVLFADMDLIGIPHRLVLSERGLAAGNAEYKGRREEKPRELPLKEVVAFLKKA
jgi:prolyl-tRNA synthetase